MMFFLLNFRTNSNPGSLKAAMYSSHLAPYSFPILYENKKTCFLFRKQSQFYNLSLCFQPLRPFLNILKYLFHLAPELP